MVLELSAVPPGGGDVGGRESSIQGTEDPWHHMGKISVIWVMSLWQVIASMAAQVPVLPILLWALLQIS